MDCTSNYTNITDNVNLDSQNLEIKVAEQYENILYLHEYNKKEAENKNIDISCTSNDSKLLQVQLDEINNDVKDTNKKFHSNKISNENGNEKSQPQLNETNNSDNDDRKMMQSQLEICNNNTTISPKFCNERRKKRDTNRINKSKKHKQKESDNAETQINIYHKLVMHVEQSVKEWVTENTLCLLIGEMNEKHQLLKNLKQHDRYQQLCKKLNRLQLEKEERVDLERDTLKPLPHFSALQEEGKKIDLKVRAFYEGRMTITSSEDNDKESKESKDDDDDDSVLPLTDAHTPNALRRRIFLDKLNKVLPDLMRTLMINAGTSSMTQFTYHEKYSLIKSLISTFNLSAINIIFKTAEWTLVGLIMIKMLSLIDVQLQSLLQSKQASMYTSMILTTYKLDSSYLDRLIMEITNTTNASN